MVCSECGQREAVVQFQALIQHHLVQSRLCEDCARQRSAQLLSQPAVLLGQLLGLLSSAAPAPLTCASCGTTYESFRASGRLGCARCYEAFAPVLAGLLQRVHGAERHSGKRPEPPLTRPLSAARAPTWPSTPTLPTNKAEEIAALEARLKRLVDAEDFDGAATARDQLRRLKGS